MKLLIYFAIIVQFFFFSNLYAQSNYYNLKKINGSDSSFSHYPFMNVFSQYFEIRDSGKVELIFYKIKNLDSTTSFILFNSFEYDNLDKGNYFFVWGGNKGFPERSKGKFVCKLIINGNIIKQFLFTIL